MIFFHNMKNLQSMSTSPSRERESEKTSPSKTTFHCRLSERAGVRILLEKILQTRGPAQTTDQLEAEALTSINNATTEAGISRLKPRHISLHSITRTNPGTSVQRPLCTKPGARRCDSRPRGIRQWQSHACTLVRKARFARTATSGLTICKGRRAGNMVPGGHQSRRGVIHGNATIACKVHGSPSSDGPVVSSLKKLRSARAHEGCKSTAIILNSAARHRSPSRATSSLLPHLHCSDPSLRPALWPPFLLDSARSALFSSKFPSSSPSFVHPIAF